MSEQNREHFNVYFVTAGGNGKKDFWLPLTRAFPHTKDSGYTVPLERLGLNGKLVLLPPKPEESQEPQP